MVCKVAALQQQHPGIESVHMSYLQEHSEAASSPSTSKSAPAISQITFLYKLVPGVADRSFGLDVARLGHLPPTVIDCAAQQAAHLEHVTLHRAR